MNKKKKTAKVLSFFLSAVLGFGCITSFTAFAENSLNGSDILDNTRYSAIGIGDIADIIQFILDMNDGEMPPAVGDADYWIQKYAEKSAELATEDTIEEAKTIYTAPNYEPYTINDSYAIMAKRRINYPYNNWYEVQYIYVYVNKNVLAQTPQQFGNYTIAPNTIFLVRQTNFDGVKAFSVPLSENGLIVQMGSAPNGSALSIKLNGNQNNTFIYDDENGRQTVGFRHYGNDFNPVRLNLINNNVNSIVDNFLIDYYNNNQSDYNTYLGSQRTLNNFEAFLGTGYDYGNSSGIMGGSPRPFYVTTAFFNTSGYDEDDAPIDRINTYFNTDPNNVNPLKPPAYVIPNDNPLSSGNTINNNTVNNYNDYGVTMLDGELHLDPDILAGALGGLINPDFVGALGGVFSAQPAIGLQFGGGSADIYNYIDLVDDFITQLIQNGSGSGSCCSRPQVPVITTFTSQQFDLSIFSTSVTYPLEIHQGSNLIWSTGESVLNAVGIPLIIIFGLALFGIGVWFIF